MEPSHDLNPSHDPGPSHDPERPHDPEQSQDPEQSHDVGIDDNSSSQMICREKPVIIKMLTEVLLFVLF